ncbi:hypothetical protein JNUCC23_08990 [Peribacillus sp. JNUCC 23]
MQEKNIVLDISKEMKKYLDENYTGHDSQLKLFSTQFENYQQ